MQENYDGLEWEIDDFPCGSSTPDEFFELSFRAKTKCPECDEAIYGTANYWSRDEDMSNCWLDSIDHEECECCENKKDEDEEEDDY